MARKAWLVSVLTVKLWQLELWRCRWVRDRNLELQIEFVLQEVVHVPAAAAESLSGGWERSGSVCLFWPHQHFPVHFVPVLSEDIVNQSLSFCLFHCRPTGDETES